MLSLQLPWTGQQQLDCKRTAAAALACDIAAARADSAADTAYQSRPAAALLTRGMAALSAVSNQLSEAQTQMDFADSGKGSHCSD